MKDCKHVRLKVRKHKVNADPCLHCLDCMNTWSSGRGMYFLKKFKEIKGIEHEKGI